MKRQFETIDKDKDGYVDKDELVEYMIKLTGNKVGSTEDLSPEEQEALRNRFDDIINEIFQVMDKSDDQKVGIDEFVDNFFEQFKLLQEEIEELDLRIKD